MSQQEYIEEPTTVEKKELPLAPASQSAPSFYAGKCWIRYQEILIQVECLLRNAKLELIKHTCLLKNQVCSNSKLKRKLCTI